GPNTSRRLSRRPPLPPQPAFPGDDRVRSAAVRQAGGAKVLKVVGTGVGRTGTHSLKLALEQLLGGPCHHMVEVFAHQDELPVWTAAIDGKQIDWGELMKPYVAQVDWPGASFWPELSAANPDALVLLSVRDPDRWYTSCSNTIFGGLQRMVNEGNE